jgi:hypothetical protein
MKFIVNFSGVVVGATWAAHPGTLPALRGEGGELREKTL